MKLAEAFAKKPGQGAGQKLSQDYLAEQLAKYLLQNRIEYMQQQWDGKDEGIGELAPTVQRYDTYESFIEGAGRLSPAADNKVWRAIHEKANRLTEKRWDQYVENL